MAAVDWEDMVGGAVDVVGGGTTGGLGGIGIGLVGTMWMFAPDDSGAGTSSGGGSSRARAKKSWLTAART